VIPARFRIKCSDLVRKRKVFVKNKANVASGVGCSERGVVYFRELLLSPIRSVIRSPQADTDVLTDNEGKTKSTVFKGNSMLLKQNKKKQF